MIASTYKGNYHIMIISTDYGSLSTITSVTVPHWLQETKLNLFLKRLKITLIHINRSERA
jgi:hypothetical protein